MPVTGIVAQDEIFEGIATVMTTGLQVLD